MVYYDFDHQKQIMISRFEGDILLKEIIDYIDAARFNKEYPRKLKILTDSRRSNMLLTPEDLPKIVEANLKSLEVYEYIVDAIVLENPNDTAISYLYGEISRTGNYFFKLFSTYDSALTWLLNFNPVV